MTSREDIRLVKPRDNFYRAFGLSITSEIQLPELLPGESETKADVVIRWGDVPYTLENPKTAGVRYQGKAGEFLLWMDNIARFHVLEGKQIIVEALPGGEETDIRLFLLGSVFGALLHQRGMMPLHAGAVRVGNQCVVFCGASGNGKSTTVNALVKRGYPLHSDDLCVTGAAQIDGKDVPVVFPGYPHLKLWRDTLEQMGENSADYPRVRRVLEKYAVPTKEQFNTEPLPIRKIYILIPWEKKEIEMKDITGMEKFMVLKNQTYRYRFLESQGNEISHFKSAGLIGGRVPIARVGRPRDLFLLDPLIDLLEKDFSTLN